MRIAWWKRRISICYPIRVVYISQQRKEPLIGIEGEEWNGDSNSNEALAGLDNKRLNTPLFNMLENVVHSEPLQTCSIKLFFGGWKSTLYSVPRGGISDRLSSTRLTASNLCPTLQPRSF